MKLSAAAVVVVVLVVHAGCSSKSSAPPPSAASLPSGIDVAGMDKSVAPGDDFYAYANGGWLKATPIPADKSEYGVATMLVDQTRKQTVDIIQDPANAGPNATPDARKVGDFYASFMDEAGIESKGITPLKPQLDSIAAIADKRGLARVIGGTLRADVDPLNATNFQTEHLLGVFVAQGLNDPDHNTPYLLQGGLGHARPRLLPVQSPKMAALRTEYKRHVGAIMTLAGFSGAAGARGAYRRSRDENRGGARDTRESADVHSPQAVDERGARGEGARPRLVRRSRGRRPERGAELHRLASRRGHRALGTRGEGAARGMEGLARLSHRERGDGRSCRRHLSTKDLLSTARRSTEHPSSGRGGSGVSMPRASRSEKSSESSMSSDTFRPRQKPRCARWSTI